MKRLIFNATLAAVMWCAGFTAFGALGTAPVFIVQQTMHDEVWLHPVDSYTWPNRGNTPRARMLDWGFYPRSGQARLEKQELNSLYDRSTGADETMKAEKWSWNGSTFTPTSWFDMVWMWGTNTPPTPNPDTDLNHEAFEPFGTNIFEVSDYKWSTLCDGTWNMSFLGRHERVCELGST